MDRIILYPSLNILLFFIVLFLTSFSDSFRFSKLHHKLFFPTIYNSRIYHTSPVILFLSDFDYDIGPDEIRDTEVEDSFEILDEDDTEDDEEYLDDTSTDTVPKKSKKAINPSISNNVTETMTWKEKRARPRQQRKKKSWEENLMDDPLRGDNPTRDYVPPPDKFTKHFISVAKIDTAERLQNRISAWTHHMQWVRRSALLPHSPAKVAWEYTQLSDDCVTPIGQIVGIRANTSDAVSDLLALEPLEAVEGIGGWQTYEFLPVEGDNATCDARTQHIFIGIDKSTKAAASKREALVDQHLSYHQQTYNRTTLFGHLIPINTMSTTTTPTGTLIVFNARSNADAQRYMAADPLVKAGIYTSTLLSPVNEQDIDGLHHAMARTFAAKTQLDQLHYMEPEDLLLQSVTPIEKLPNHSILNQEVLKELKANKISYKYNRLSWKERYGQTLERNLVTSGIKTWKDTFGNIQRIRLEPVAKNRFPNINDEVGELMTNAEASQIVNLSDDDEEDEEAVEE